MTTLIMFAIIYVISIAFYYRQTRIFYKDEGYIEPEIIDVIVTFIPVFNTIAAVIVWLDNISEKEKGGPTKFFRLK